MWREALGRRTFRSWLDAVGAGALERTEENPRAKEFVYNTLTVKNPFS